METAASIAQEVMDLEKEYLLQNYARYPLVLSHGKGAYLWDVEGRRYLDFISGIGVNALGHDHPRIVAVIAEQATRLIHSSNLYYHQYQGPLAKRIVESSGMARVFFGNTGTEVVEGALKMVRSHGTKIHPGKFEIISLENSFHGRTLGALSVTGQPKYRKDFEPLLPGAGFVPKNDIPALEQAFSEHTAGMILEVIQGEGGVFPVSQDYLVRVRELCDRHDALLVFDETQCGVGRPGTYFSYQNFDPPILPDVMVAAKPIACGLPLGFIAANEKAAAAIAPGMHGSTFGGGPLACRVALEFFDLLDDLLPQIRRVGAYFRARLLEARERYPIVKQVRGQGLILGVELAIPGSQLVLDAMEEGFLMNCTHGNVLRFLPPYIITESEVDEAMAVLEKVLAKADRDAGASPAS
ncbi:MAG: acetylornithine aminotransferase [Bryobacterales bacterium]|nr:acetylornithine aminotransferase [Bryobacterales bacterium]